MAAFNRRDKNNIEFARDDKAFDLERNHNFDCDVHELKKFEPPVDKNMRKVDVMKLNRHKKLKFIMNYKVS